MVPANEAPATAVHAALQDGASVLIDVREPWEHQQMRVAGSRLIPLGELPGRLTEVPSDRDVYVLCRSGSRSARAVEFLRSSGRTRAVNVAGGIEAWAGAGLPVE